MAKPRTRRRPPGVGSRADTLLPVLRDRQRPDVALPSGPSGSRGWPNASARPWSSAVLVIKRSTPQPPDDAGAESATRTRYSRPATYDLLLRTRPEQPATKPDYGSSAN